MRMKHVGMAASVVAMLALAGCGGTNGYEATDLSASTPATEEAVEETEEAAKDTKTEKSTEGEGSEVEEQQVEEQAQVETPKDEAVDQAETSEPTIQEKRAANDAVLFPNDAPEEIEYARLWYDHTKSQTPPHLTVLFKEAGAPINESTEDETIVFPEDVVILVGEFTADGMMTYHSNGDGTINVYDVPSHWHQDSDEKIRLATQRVLDTVTTRDVPEGDPDAIAYILRNMSIDHFTQ